MYPLGLRAPLGWQAAPTLPPAGVGVQPARASPMMGEAQSWGKAPAPPSPPPVQALAAPAPASWPAVPAAAAGSQPAAPPHPSERTWPPLAHGGRRPSKVLLPRPPHAVPPADSGRLHALLRRPARRRSPLGARMRGDPSASARAPHAQRSSPAWHWPWSGSCARGAMPSPPPCAEGQHNGPCVPSWPSGTCACGPC